MQEQEQLADINETRQSEQLAGKYREKKDNSCPTHDL